MTIASASDLVVKYGPHTVLDGVTIAIHKGDRIGLVGRNGCGKSTFLRIAAGADEPDSGEFTIRRGLVIGYLPQIFDLDEESSVLENVMSGAQRVLDLITEYENTPAEAAKASELLDEINLYDGWTIDQQATSLLTNLHAPDSDRKVGTLSGGEKRRVALCRALIAKPEFLILDEPTNNLDTQSIEWLEQFLAKYTGTCLFVTHDRYFLDRIATQIVEIARGVCHNYKGNYTEYLLERAERMDRDAMSEHKRQRFLKKELEWVRKSPSARRSKSKDRIDKFFEIKDQEAPEEELDVDLIIPPAPKLGNRVIDVKNATMGFGGKTLFSNLDFALEGGECVGIVGRNGLGKSTLLKVILGMLQPDGGEVHIGARAEINYIDQDRLMLDDTKSVFEEVGEGQENVRLGDETIGLRSYLKRFLFTDDRINTRIDLLSGGERSRVLLAKILKRGGNVLVLDEPTNDLDLSTLRLLEDALDGFKGSVLVVSHDRYFLNRVCTGILAFEGEGEVGYHVGNYDYYLEKKAQREAKSATVTAATKAKSKAQKKQPRKLKWAEEKELETIEQTIMEAEEKVESMTTNLNDPDFFEKNGNRWQQLEQELKDAKKAAKDLYDHWEELEAVKAAWAAYKAN